MFYLGNLEEIQGKKDILNDFKDTYIRKYIYIYDNW